MDAQGGSILDQFVVPAFGDGEFDRGFVDGLEGVTNAINLQQTIAQTGAPTVYVDQSEPVDLTGLWSVIKWIIFLAVIACVVLLLYRARRNRHRTRVTQQEARTAYGQCTEFVRDLRLKVQSHEALITSMEDISTISRIAGWNKEAAGISASFDAFANNVAGSRENPHRDGFSLAEYESMLEHYEDLRLGLKNLSDREAAFRADIELEKQLAESIDDDLAQATTDVESAENRISAIAGRGFDVDELAGVFGELTGQLAPARTAADDKAYNTAKQLADEAIAIAQSTAKKAEKLPATKARLEKRLAALRDDVVDVRTFIEQGRGVFDQLEAAFAEVCWEELIGNGTEAENNADDAEAQIEVLTDAISEQSWDDARNAAQTAVSELKEAKELIQAILDREEHLDQSRKAAPEEIRDAHADLDTAHEYVTRHDGDTDDGHFTSIANARGLVQEAEVLLAQSQPNYLHIVRLARQANEAADEVLADAREERAAAERKRKKTVTAAREARSSVLAAENYIRNHRRDVKQKAKRLVLNAVSLLDSMETAESDGDVDSIIRLATAADDTADDALKKAKRNVHDAEEARRPVYRSEDDDDDDFDDFFTTSIGSSRTRSWGTSTRRHTPATPTVESTGSTSRIFGDAGATGTTSRLVGGAGSTGHVSRKW